MSKKMTNEERERLQKLNDTFLYEIGYQHMNNICEETDQLLEKYKDLEVPDSLDEWFTKFNKGFERKKKYQKIKKRAIKIGKRVATILIIASMAASITTISVEAFRATFFNLVIETTEKFTLVSQKETSDNSVINQVPSDWEGYYYPEYLPKDYVLDRTNTLNDTKIMIFENGMNDAIKFIQGSLNSQTQLNSENGEVKEVDINGNQGVLVINEDIKILYWTNNDKSFIIQGNIEESVLLAMAKDVIKNK